MNRPAISPAQAKTTREAIMHIIIIDDDIKMADLLKTALQMAFYEKAKNLAKGQQSLTESLDVIKFNHQQQALQYLDEKKKFVDLVFLEINTPGMNEFDFIKLCQGTYQDQVGEIVVVTDRSDKQAIQRGLKAGAVDYILKPFSPNDLKIHIFNVWQEHLSN